MNEWQVWLIGAISSIMVFILKELLKHKIELHRSALTLILFAISYGLAWAFNPLAIPPLPVWQEPYIPQAIEWIVSFVNALALPVGAAMTIYNIFLQKVLEAIKSKL